MSNNMQVVREMYEAFGRKDEVRLRQLLHVDIEWIQCAGFPGGGHRHGADEVVEAVFRGLHAEWHDWRVEIEDYLDAGKTVVVLGHYAGTHAITNRSMTAVFAHVYDVEGGQVTRFRQYTDTAQLVTAALPDPVQ